MLSSVKHVLDNAFETVQDALFPSKSLRKLIVMTGHRPFRRAVDGILLFAFDIQVHRTVRDITKK